MNLTRVLVSCAICAAIAVVVALLLGGSVIAAIVTGIAVGVTGEGIRAWRIAHGRTAP